MKFDALPLHEALLTSLNANGFNDATPIQEQAIPAILEGQDVLACAQTGTGKTLAFALPMLNRLLNEPVQPASKQLKHLILTPTRELAEQVASSIKQLVNQDDINVVTAYGGVSINPQQFALKKGAHIVVATPGRLLDLARTQSVLFDEVTTLVLDEADRMLDLGFKDELAQITRQLPEQKQVLLFSATFNKHVKQFAHKLLDQPQEIAVTPQSSLAVDISEEFFTLANHQKAPALAYLIGSRNYQQALVFMRQKVECDALVKELKKDGIKADSLHGDKSQGARNRALEEFKEGKIRALIATDVAARGIDITELPVVFNFQLPFKVEDYVHRVGRTGRAGKTGHAITFVANDDEFRVEELERLLDKRLTPVWLKGFEPDLNEVDTTQEKKKRRKKQSAKAKARAKASFSVKRK